MYFMVAVSPKEYLELFEDKKVNKKQEIQKGSTDLGFENFSNRITSLVNFDTFEKPPIYTKKISKLQVVNGEMIRITVTKNKFSQLDDKRFYFPNGVVSLPFHHPPLAEFTKGIGVRRRMVDEVNYTYDAKFEGNILVVGRTCADGR